MEETPAAYSWLPTFLQNSKSKKTSSGHSSPDEWSSLIPKLNSPEPSESDGNGEVFDLEDNPKSTSKHVLGEFKILLKGSIPVILAYMLQNSLQTISVVIVGRASPEDLATAAFSYMFAMSSAWLIALGGTTALDTLCSATFTGSRNSHDLGVLLQRAFIVLGLFYIPVAILWFCSEPLFRALGQTDQLSRDSARFLWCLIPGGLGYIYFEAMKKYLQAQGLSSHFCLISHSCISRDYATRHVRPPHYFTHQCRPQLPPRLHFQNGSVRSTNRDRYILLALVPIAIGICTFRQRLGLMGRMVTQMFTEPGYLFASRHPRCGPRRNRMVGI